MVMVRVMRNESGCAASGISCCASLNNENDGDGGDGKDDNDG